MPVKSSLFDGTSDATEGDPSPAGLFPHLGRLAAERGWLRSFRGAPLVKLQRILGSGRTRARGLDAPPSPVERKLEYSTFKWPEDPAPIDTGALREKGEVRREVEDLSQRMRRSEMQRRFALQVMQGLELPEEERGIRDNQFFALPFVLAPGKGGMSWSWGITKHYPVIKDLPPDVDYVRMAYREGRKSLEREILPGDSFLQPLRLAWMMARNFSSGEDVLIADVAQKFKIAVQGREFWERPCRKNFEDVPDGVFIANLIQLKRQGGGLPFELVPATLNQVRGRAFFVPTNAEGTEVKPMIYLRRRRA